MFPLSIAQLALPIEAIWRAVPNFLEALEIWRGVPRGRQ